ncbi:hypothetical protein CL619_03315 [archaeon]|nr:hypothetical protein [archaeon]|tara:strand:+ start:2510 stop:2797 length:288 start_codon:yes stop_codon:yes gene_type:complete
MNDSVISYDRMSNVELLSTLHALLGEAVDLPAVNLTELGVITDDATFFLSDFWEDVRDAYETLAYICKDDMPQAGQIYQLLEGREKLFYGRQIDE